ncbi:MAG: aminotransferase class IV [Actinobacteria bacterium]|nr:aminotransferase class IV [Actinomycetota bacterium]
MLQAWVDGELVPAGEARVSVYDRGFRLGEGVFETFRAYGDHVFRLAAHLDRAVRGASFLGFGLDAASLSRAVTATASANLTAHDGRDSVVRLTATPGRLDPETPFPGRAVGGPTVVVTSHPLVVDPEVHRDGLTATLVPWARELPDVKAVSYLAATVAREHARARGADEALLTDPDGNVLEGSSSNVFAVLDGTLVTPPPSAGLLAGVTRGVVLEVAAGAGVPVEERPLSVADLSGADEAFLTATTREVMPLVRVGDDRIGDGHPGPLTRSLHEGYRDEVRREATTRR